MALTLASRVSPAPDLAFRDIGGEGVLLDLTSGTYFGLNRLGTRAWVLLAEGRSLADLHAQLASELDVTRETLERDLLTWAGTLLEQRLLVEL
jgi:hypothetical protein